MAQFFLYRRDAVGARQCDPLLGHEYSAIHRVGARDIALTLAEHVLLFCRDSVCAFFFYSD